MSIDPILELYSSEKSPFQEKYCSKLSFSGSNFVENSSDFFFFFLFFFCTKGTEADAICTLVFVARFENLKRQNTKNEKNEKRRKNSSKAW